MARPVIVSVEAAIASGKSTLLGLVEKELGMDVYVVQEPVLEWQAIDGNPEHNLLDKFYQDSSRWGYSFQTYVFLTRVRAVENAIEFLRKEGRLETTAILVERSYLTDKETFGSILLENGSITGVEWAMYESWWNWLIKKTPLFSGHIYMRTSVDTVMQRLNKRNRGEESGVSLDYQSKLITKHEQWVARQQAKNTPLLIVNADVDFLTNEDHLHRICTRIAGFFETLRYENARPITPEPSMRIPKSYTPLPTDPSQQEQEQEKDWGSVTGSTAGTSCYKHEKSSSASSMRSELSPAPSNDAGEMKSSRKNAEGKSNKNGHLSSCAVPQRATRVPSTCLA